MVVDLADWVDEVGMAACSDAGVHFVDGRAVRSHFAFEKLDCHGFWVG